MRKYQAVLFDLDGTLLDSLADIADSMNKVLADLNLPTHPHVQYRYFVGSGMETLVRRALPPQQVPETTVAKALDAMRREYHRNWQRQTRPYHDIPELLSTLAGQHFKLAILSNKPDDFTRKCVANLLDHKLFTVVRGARPDTPKKPDPAGALAVAAQLALPPESFCYVGDSGIDMQTARGAGMFAVGVRWGFREAEELLANGADRLISRPLELLQLLDH
ncbi:HAD family hydrolase [Desulfurivibrio dismutans]|uniref:HAD family hydrolase n=1 Tax=Desulfurivibrio dismutans TaxID=1398908 RepID=UPI0023DA8D6C|nr:HAD family hydrolase [Desulfurivibrio alkaliphilus]MDF1614863.1 HAD family hydrolase [Desulfurivibrio alkaliphilus]